MAETGKTLSIAICMGSSCYSRGNSRNIETIRQFLADHQLNGETHLVGHLCEDNCRNGPNLKIDGKSYQQVDTATLLTMLENAVRVGAKAE